MFLQLGCVWALARVREGRQSRSESAEGRGGQQNARDRQSQLTRDISPRSVLCSKPVGP